MRKKKTTFARMEKKIDKSRILKAVNDKLGLVDKFINKILPPDKSVLNIKHHTIEHKKWTPSEKRVFGLGK